MIEHLSNQLVCTLKQLNVKEEEIVRASLIRIINWALFLPGYIPPVVTSIFHRILYCSLTPNTKLCCTVTSIKYVRIIMKWESLIVTLNWVDYMSWTLSRPTTKAPFSCKIYPYMQSTDIETNAKESEYLLFTKDCARNLV